MLRLDNATPASPLLRSILSFTFDIGLCGGEILLFFEFMNIAIIVILSPISSSCSITALIFFFAGTTSTKFAESYLIDFQMCYQHILVQVVWLTSAAYVLMEIFWVLFLELAIARYLFVQELLQALSVLIVLVYLIYSWIYFLLMLYSFWRFLC